MNEEVNNERKFNRVRKHFRDNWKHYAIGTAGFTVGVVGTIAYMVKHGYAVSDEENRRIQKAYFEGIINRIQVNRSKNISIQTISIYGKKIGRPGIPVIDMTTGKRYESITLVAKAIGVDRAQIDKQLRGKIDQVNGHKFVYAD